MADTKISALTEATDLVDSQSTGIQSGVNKRFPIALYDARFAAASHTHTVSQISDLTASVTELNYTDGVTSAIQTQLDGKAASTHSHAISDVTSLQSTLDAKQPLDTQLTSLSGLTYASNGSKFIRVNAGETAFELAAIAGGGDVTGDDTTTVVQNIVAYSTTGGKNITELTGSQGDMLIYDTGVSSWVKLAKGTFGQVLRMNSASTYPEWAYGGMIHYSKSTGATTTGANTTPVSVSGAVFDYVASAVYKIWVMGRVTSTAATTGIGLQFDLSSAVTAINAQFYHQLAATGTTSGGHSIADDTSAGVSSGVPTGPLDVPVTLDGLLVTGANTGTAQLRLRSETTAVTELLAGTVMLVWRVA